MEDCKHEILRVRKVVQSNGSVHFCRQCQTCGYKTTSIKREEVIKLHPDLDNIPLYDPELAKGWERRQSEMWREIRESLRKSAFDPITHTEKYHRYLQSSEWVEKKIRIWNRDKGICQACLEAQGAEVHHKTYDHVFYEPLFDLELVCRKCHETIHGFGEKWDG